ncbi:hypothetical protein CKO23_00975 [Thiocystis violacea]|nr:hypothetical protein [Thiocystis violacea]
MKRASRKIETRVVTEGLHTAIALGTLIMGSCPSRLDKRKTESSRAQSAIGLAHETDQAVGSHSIAVTGRIPYTAPRAATPGRGGIL